MARILCLGMSALDAIYRVPAIPSTPTKVIASGFIECGGGMAANASVAVARLGGQVSYWGRLGADDRGTRILHELSCEGVDISAVRRVPGAASPADAILVDDAGERLVLRVPRPAARPRTLPGCPWTESPISTRCWPTFAGPRAQRLSSIRRWRRGSLRCSTATSARATSARSRRTSDARCLLRSPVPGHGGPASRTLVKALPALPARCVGGGWRDLGACGFLWREGASERRIPAPRVDAIDTLGAGDVWHGGLYACARRGGGNVAEAARFANAAAALKCTRMGGPTSERQPAIRWRSYSTKYNKNC